MSSAEIEVPREDLRGLLIYAYRYGITRASYARGDVLGMLRRYGPGLLSAHDWRLAAEDARRLSDEPVEWMDALADEAVSDE